MSPTPLTKFIVRGQDILTSLQEAPIDDGGAFIAALNAMERLVLDAKAVEVTRLTAYLKACTERVNVAAEAVKKNAETLKNNELIDVDELEDIRTRVDQAVGEKIACAPLARMTRLSTAPPPAVEEQQSDAASSSSDEYKPKKSTRTYVKRTGNRVSRIGIKKNRRLNPAVILDRVVVVRSDVEVLTYVMQALKNEEYEKLMLHENLGSVVVYKADAVGAIMYHPVTMVEAAALKADRAPCAHNKWQCVFPVALVNCRKKLIMLVDQLPASLQEEWKKRGSVVHSLLSDAGPADPNMTWLARDTIRVNIGKTGVGYSQECWKKSHMMTR